MMSNGPIEPNADARQFAAAMRGMYLALVQEGFTEQQAMYIIAVAISSYNK